MNLTFIPLDIPDEKALVQLCQKITSDVDVLLLWARKSVESYLARTERRPIELEQENSGVEVTFAEWIENLDIQPQQDSQEYYGGRCRSEITNQLGAVSPTSLIPFCAILVYNHPEITPSFLENLMIFDKNGKAQNYTKINGRMVLKGEKPRKGALLAEQTIVLNDEAQRAIEGILRATEYCRTYLRKINDQTARYLLISSGRSLQKPYNIKRLASLTSGSNVKSLASSISQLTNSDIRFARILANRFSLRTLRASVAVITYFKTQSISITAKTLGHTQVDERLMESYLPKPIVHFFRDRWVRIFQTGLVLEAMKESKHYHFVTQLTNDDEIQRFLKNHGISFPLFGEHRTDIPTCKGELLIGVTVELLVLFLRLKSNYEDGSTISINKIGWAKFGERIIDEIKCKSDSRPDLYKTFLIAQSLMQSGHL